MNITPIQAVDAAVAASNAVSKSSDVDFSSYLKTDKTLNDIFEEASQTYGVSVDLLRAIAKQESNFNPSATSRSGAQGVMQLMPQTAAGLGVSNAYDPYQNIMGGAKYIRQMLDQYNGNVSLALAAYNAGSNNVDKYGGIPPFAETQNYVAKITQYLQTGVTVPDNIYSAVSTVNGDTQVTYGDLNNLAEDLLNEIFSYDDYLKLLSTLIGQSNMNAVLSMSVSSSFEPSADSSSNSSTDTYTSYQELTTAGAVTRDALLGTYLKDA